MTPEPEPVTARLRKRPLTISVGATCPDCRQRFASLSYYAKGSSRREVSMNIARKAWELRTDIEQHRCKPQEAKHG